MNKKGYKRTTLEIGNLQSLVLLKKKRAHRPPIGVTGAQPMSVNKDVISNLTAAAASLREVTCNQSTWDDLVSSGEVIYPTGPRPAPKGR